MKGLAPIWSWISHRLVSNNNIFGHRGPIKSFLMEVHFPPSGENIFPRWMLRSVVVTTDFHPMKMVYILPQNLNQQVIGRNPTHTFTFTLLNDQCNVTDTLYRFKYLLLRGLHCKESAFPSVERRYVSLAYFAKVYIFKNINLQKQIAWKWRF